MNTEQLSVERFPAESSDHCTTDILHAPDTKSNVNTTLLANNSDYMEKYTKKIIHIDIDLTEDVTDTPTIIVVEDSISDLASLDESAEHSNTSDLRVNDLLPESNISEQSSGFKEQVIESHILQELNGNNLINSVTFNNSEGRDFIENVACDNSRVFKKIINNLDDEVNNCHELDDNTDLVAVFSDHSKTDVLLKSDIAIEKIKDCNMYMENVTISNDKTTTMKIDNCNTPDLVKMDDTICDSISKEINNKCIEIGVDTSTINKVHTGSLLDTDLKRGVQKEMLAKQMFDVKSNNVIIKTGTSKTRNYASKSLSPKILQIETISKTFNQNDDLPKVIKNTTEDLEFDRNITEEKGYFNQAKISKSTNTSSLTTGISLSPSNSKELDHKIHSSSICKYKLDFPSHQIPDVTKVSRFIQGKQSMNLADRNKWFSIDQSPPRKRPQNRVHKKHPTYNTRNLNQINLDRTDFIDNKSANDCVTNKVSVNQFRNRNFNAVQDSLVRTHCMVRDVSAVEPFYLVSSYVPTTRIGNSGLRRTDPAIDVNNTTNGNETKLPFKKRRMSVNIKQEVDYKPEKEEISYPATPMISIAEVEALHTESSTFGPFMPQTECIELLPMPVYCNFSTYMTSRPFETLSEHKDPSSYNNYMDLYPL